MDVVCCLAPPLQSQNNESCTNDFEMCEWATPLIKEPWNHNAVHSSVHAYGQYKKLCFQDSKSSFADFILIRFIIVLSIKMPRALA